VRIEAGDKDAELKALAAPWRKYQMPAYHLTTPDGDGVTLVNIGVGPSNAKTITDHLAVLRPHCWLMIGHCGGLRHTQRIGDYVLAHAYLRRDKVLDDRVPLEVPIPAIAEVQIALQQAATAVSSDKEDLRRRLRTGTVVSYADRNWELNYNQERQLLSQSRAIAVDMESACIATQGFRMRVPYGVLLCISDKPAHGEIKLPGVADRFYDSAIGAHLRIGLETIALLKQNRDRLHSRKLRAFDEPPFR
jgi:AMP nucleosidase